MLSALLLAQTLRSLTGLEPGPGPEEVEILPSEATYIEANWGETVVRGRPWVPHKRVATISDGTRLVVRGEVVSRDEKGCHGKNWYAVYPFGFVCSEHARPAKKGPEPGRAMPLGKGKRLPHTYAYVRSDGIPMYNGYADVDAGIPSRPLTKGMSLVVSRTLEYDGQDWIQTSGGALVPKDGVRYGGQGSDWAGVVLSGDHTGPSFAWVNLKKGAPVLRGPDPEAERAMSLDLRTRVPLLEREREGERVWWRVGEGLWMDGAHLNEVHIASAAPDEALGEWRAKNTGNDQWIDVDLGEQTLIAYRGDRAVFATMISSGKSMPTPRGDYPIWAKVASMTMANQAYEDKPYMVQGVPWVLLFQGHNALHGAYWHDRFGNRKSHGCVNLAPYDARWVFEWTGPVMPRGWTGYLPSDLRRSPVVHVRNSSVAREFVQDRPIGPPDREAESARSSAADERRAASDGDYSPVYDPEFVPGGGVPEPDVLEEIESAGQAGAHLEPRLAPDIGIPGEA